MPEPVPVSPSPHAAPTASPQQRSPRRWAVALKTLGGLLMIVSILTVVFGSWAISGSTELILLCTLGWIGGFILFIAARKLE